MCPKKSTKVPQIAPKVPHIAPKVPQNVQKLPQFVLKRQQIAPKMTQLWKIIRLKIISRAGQHHRKHMLDDPPNMIDPINYVLLFCSIPLFKSFHVACMDNYVLKVTVIYLHLWWSCFILFWTFLVFSLTQPGLPFKSDWLFTDCSEVDRQSMVGWQ